MCFPMRGISHFADLVFRNAANFAQRGGVILGTGWHADNCTVEVNNAGGMSLNGDNILVDHCTAAIQRILRHQRSAAIITPFRIASFAEITGKDFRRTGKGAAGNSAEHNHLRVIRHTSYENTGPGLWLDIDNRDYSIMDSTFYGNHGFDADWQGSGICLEINPGPGVVTNNIIYSNTGGGNSAGGERTHLRHRQYTGG